MIQRVNLNILRLRIVEPNSRVPREVDLVDGLVLGRSPTVGLMIADPFLSRQHLRFVASGGRFLVEHIGGSNGTQIVEGPLLKSGEVHPLGAGTRISLGATRIEVIGSFAAVGEELGATTVVGFVGPASVGPVAVESESASDPLGADLHSGDRTGMSHQSGDLPADCTGD